jgi:hypothetical protein
MKPKHLRVGKTNPTCFLFLTTKEEDRMLHRVYRQEWLESERGWGTRPDGYSLHLSLSDIEAYVKEYWDSMPNEVPDEYSRPEGGPREISVETKIYKQVKDSKNGIRLYR